MRHRPDPYAIAAAAAFVAIALLVAAIYGVASASRAGATPPADQVCAGTHLAPGTSHNGPWGTITSSAAGVTYDLEAGYQATICVKAGSASQGLGPQTVTVTGAGHIDPPGDKALSHWAALEITPPSTSTTDPTTTTVPPTTTTEPAPSSTTTTSSPATTSTAPSTTTTTSSPTTTETTEPSDTTSTTTPPATSTTAPPPPTTGDDEPETPPSTSPPPAELPRTGIGTGPLAAAALALLALGGTAVTAARRH